MRDFLVDMVRVAEMVLSILCAIMVILSAIGAVCSIFEGMVVLPIVLFILMCAFGVGAMRFSNGILSDRFQDWLWRNW